ncbi:hypothetical protein D3C85_1120340 [compost metagenome]
MMPVPSLGPLLVATSVNTTFVPAAGVALLTVLTIARSETAPGAGVEVEVLLPGVGSFSVPVMVAVLA